MKMRLTNCKGSSISIGGDEMDAVFLQVLNMSLTASYVILFVFGRKATFEEIPENIFLYIMGCRPVPAHMPLLF